VKDLLDPKNIPANGSIISDLEIMIILRTQLRVFYKLYLGGTDGRFNIKL
jgi:hypothetical protein